MTSNLDFLELVDTDNYLASYIGQPNVASYSFYLSPSEEDLQAVAGDQIISYHHTEPQKEFIRSVFLQLDPLIDLDFAEAISGETGDIQIIRMFYSENYKDDNSIGGYASPESDHYAVTWKEQSSEKLDKLNNFEKSSIVHEIGHALGLSHPGGDWVSGNEGGNPDWNIWDSTMSYNQCGKKDPEWFRPLDIQALQHIWGSESEFIPEEQLGKCGKSINPDKEKPNTQIETEIEKIIEDGYITLIGTASDDLIKVKGNQPHDLFGESGNDILIGGKKDDILDGGKGDDRLKGKKGPDLYVLSPGKDQFLGFKLKQGDTIEIDSSNDYDLVSFGGGCKIEHEFGVTTIKRVKPSDLESVIEIV